MKIIKQQIREIQTRFRRCNICIIGVFEGLNRAQQLETKEGKEQQEQNFPESIMI